MIKLSNPFIALALLLTIVITISSCSRGVLINQPEFTVKTDTIEKTRKVIVRVLVGRNWSVEKESPGEIIAVLHARKHMVKIEITYDEAGKVVMKYRDSANMRFKQKNGKKFIHAKYVKWLKILERDIKKRSAMMMLE